MFVATVRPFLRRAGLLAPLLLLLLPGACGDELPVTPEGPDTPEGTGETFVVTGEVHVAGTERPSELGPENPRSVTDADGIPVRLVGEGQTRESVSAAGRFSFTDVPPGTYEVVAGPLPVLERTSGPFPVEQDDVEIAAPLILAEAGPMEIFPNPIAGGATRIQYFLAVGEDVLLTVRDLAGNLVRTLHDGFVPSGFHAATWPADDNLGSPVPIGAYWVVLESDGVGMAELVFADEVAGPIERFTVTISSSDTDPWQNTGDPEILHFLYTWLICGPDEGADGVLLRGEPAAAGSLLTYVGTGGWLNVGTDAEELILTSAGCPTGPVLMGHWIAVGDSATGIRVGLGDVSQSWYSGPSAATRCSILDTHPVDWVGFSSDGAPPDSFLADGVLNCAPRKEKGPAPKYGAP
ncbi:MAG: hypothetical protein HKN12_00955 [Gemmatimonadetes bacterium]|nr:hypothetical protein [Gemmatimonadota bacterium]